MSCKTVFMGVVALLLTLGVNLCVGMSVFTESARFERLSHFKDAGLVHHLNTVDQAMIADGIYRMFKTSTYGDSGGQVLKAVIRVIKTDSYLQMNRHLRTGTLCGRTGRSLK